VFGFIVAWTLVRYRFPGRRFIDAMIDMPFALPTAVSGMALTAVFAGNGWIGQYLEPLGHQGGLRAAGHRHRADADRHAVRRAHGAAGARRNCATWRMPRTLGRRTWLHVFRA
jgi:ABC-type sugar transport system permease subunit